MVLNPILPTQGLAMLYSKRGLGKTYLTLGAALAVARGGRFLCWNAYSGDVIRTFRRDVNSHSDDVNKVGAQRRWGCNHATSFCQQSRGTIIHHHFVSVFGPLHASALST